MQKRGEGGGRRKPAVLTEGLDRHFPDVEIALDYANPLELLMATILSAQCTDARVNQVTPALFNRYRTAADYAGADLRTLEDLIRPTGFFRAKARNMISASRILMEKYGGEVPRTMEELTGLPGVGRKTANVILGNCFNVPSIVVDTHVRRVSRRLGLTRHENPERIEEDLMKLLPRERWTRISHQILLHGRHVCVARKPHCSDCRLTAICDYFKNTVKKGNG
jgi:endonuclease-3